jgi:hypothetical protein
VRTSGEKIVTRYNIQNGHATGIHHEYGLLLRIYVMAPPGYPYMYRFSTLLDPYMSAMIA